MLISRKKIAQCTMCTSRIALIAIFLIASTSRDSAVEQMIYLHVNEASSYQRKAENWKNLFVSLLASIIETFRALSN